MTRKPRAEVLQVEQLFPDGHPVIVQPLFVLEPEAPAPYTATPAVSVVAACEGQLPLI